MKSKSPLPAWILSERNSLMAAGDSTEDFHDPSPPHPTELSLFLPILSLMIFRDSSHPCIVAELISWMMKILMANMMCINLSPGDQANIVDAKSTVHYRVDVHQPLRYAPPMPNTIAPSMIRLMKSTNMRRTEKIITGVWTGIWMSSKSSLKSRWELTASLKAGNSQGAYCINLWVWVIALHVGH